MCTGMPGWTRRASVRRFRVSLRRRKPPLQEQAAQLRLRLSREAAAAGCLNHPGIVTVYQLGEHENTVYIAMELLRGTSLEEILKSGPMRDLPKVMSLLAQIADALDYAHSNGIVHRDIKSANILVRQDGKVKITDFGIAKIRSQNITQTGTALGAPAYMAPEQVMALQADGRADQFSLAVMAFLMLAGGRPFEAPTADALMVKIVHDDPLLLHEVNREMPASASAVFKTALAKSPASRFGSCSESVAALGAALRDGLAVAPSAGRWASRRVIAYGGLASLVVVAAIAATWLWHPRQEKPQQPAQQAAVSVLHPDAQLQPAMPKTIMNSKDGLTYVLAESRFKGTVRSRST